MSEILDYFLIIPFLLLFMIAIFASSLILTSFQQATMNTTENTNATINQTILGYGTGVMQTFDLNFAFILIGAALALFVSAFLVDTHPAFLPFNLLVYFILIFVSAIFSNVAITFAQSSAIIAEANKFPNIIWIWENLPMLLTILAGTNIIVMFAKITRRRGGI